MAHDLTLNLIYRRVYGHVRDRIDRLSIVETDDQIRADPLAGFGPLAPELRENPQGARRGPGRGEGRAGGAAAEVVRDGVRELT